MELAEEQPVGIDAHDAVGTGAEHAPHVVAVAAADIEDALAGQIQVRGHPRPLPVRAPLGVDVHAEQLEGALAPGDQALQGGPQRSAGGLVTGGVEAQCITQFDLARL